MYARKGADGSFSEGFVGGRLCLLTVPLVNIKIRSLSFVSALVFPDSNVQPLIFVPGDILRESRGEDIA